jgi:CDP-paratose 2-epimerase
MQTCLVTGSSGLIGSEVCANFHEREFVVHGVDNNQRKVFFGPPGNTRWNERRLQQRLPRFTHHELDIRDRAGVLQLVETLMPDVPSIPPRSRPTTWPRKSRLMIST